MTVKASWDEVSKLMSETYFAHLDHINTTPFDDYEDQCKDLEDRQEAAALSVGWTIEEVVAAGKAADEAFYDSLNEPLPTLDPDFTVIHMDDDTDPSWED